MHELALTNSYTVHAVLWVTETNNSLACLWRSLHGISLCYETMHGINVRNRW